MRKASVTSVVLTLLLIGGITLYAQASAAPAFAADEADATRPAPISGTVVDRDGKPIAWAQVRVDVRLPRGPRSQTVATDKSGRFRSTLTPDSRTSHQVTLTVLARGYCCARQYWSFKDGKPLEVTLHPGHILKGKVFAEKGKPLAGAKVVMERCFAFGGSTSVNVELPDRLKSVTTGKDGSFSLSYLPSPECFEYVDASLTVSAPGRALVRKSIQREAMSDLVEVTDPLECKLDGTLYLPGKTEVAPEKTQLMVQVPTDRGSEARYAEVGKDGKFHFAELPPGKVNVMLGSRGHRPGKTEPTEWAMPAVMDVELSPEEPKELELVLVPGTLVKGTVVDQATGKGIESASILVYHPGRPEDTFPDLVTTDSRGEFTVRVAAGQATICVQSIDAKDRHIYMQPDDRPSATIVVADSEEKSDVAIKVDLTRSYDGLWEVREKPIPADFELTPGTYDLAWDPDIDCSQSVYIRSKYEGDKVCPHVKRFPKLASTRAKQMAFAFDAPEDDGLLFVVLDESKGTGKGWDTAHVDLNRNADLTDDEPVRFRLSKDGGGVRTDWVTAEAHQGPIDGDRTDYPMQVRLMVYGGDDPYVYVTRKGGRKGTIDTSKGELECIAIDTNSNGLCGDPTRIKAELEPDSPGDSIFVNTNGFGQLVPTSWSPHCIHLQKITQVGNKFYLIDVSPLGDRLSVRAYSGELGQLLVRGENIEGLKATTESMYAVSDSGYYSFEKCEGKPVTLPVGQYKVLHCSMILDTKNELNVTCIPDSRVVVGADKQSTVTVSGRLSLAIDSARKEMVLRPGVTDTINWDIKIGGKTTVSALGDRNRSNAPKVKFFKNGKLLKTTTAGYT